MKLADRIQRYVDAIQPAPLGERITRYLAACPEAVSGRGGHIATLKVAVALVHGFDLSPERARPFLEVYNQRCAPPWTDKELAHKLREADKLSPKNGKPRGWLLAESPLHVAIALVHGFDLSPERALPFLERYNQRCDPPWPYGDLLTVLREADEATPTHNRPRGWLLESTPSHYRYDPYPA